MKIKSIVHLDKIDSCFLILIQYSLIEKPQCYRFLFAKTDQLPPHLYIEHVLCSVCHLCFALGNYGFEEECFAPYCSTSPQDRQRAQLCCDKEIECVSVSTTYQYRLLQSCASDVIVQMCASIVSLCSMSHTITIKCYKQTWKPIQRDHRENIWVFNYKVIKHRCTHTHTNIVRG